MKYNEIIHVSEEFIPVFDLENEKMDQYWKLFIPNDTFRDILSSVIDSLNSENQKNPVWLQGTYGTGKTHAVLVIKHLLCDKELPHYDLEDNYLTSKLKNFREKNKVFPVIIKGTSTIDGPRRFALTIQTAVKKALIKNNMRVAVSSDFENMINILMDVPLKSDEVKGTKLEVFDNYEIISRLKNEDFDILLEVEDIFINKKGLNPIVQENIVDWLASIRNKLKDEYGIDHLMIFWDEFTGALSKINAEDILLQIQSISEARNRGLSLLIVSHRTRTTHQNTNPDVINKVMGRFELKLYSMEPVATYELMEKSIEKEKEWEDVKNSFVNIITPLIDLICVNDGSNVKKALENLYPIHPYTAFLTTFISDEIGSTKRSIFKFLHDDIDYGFRNFINTYDIDERYFLTANHLWDFFYDDFEHSGNEKITSSVEKYKLYLNTLRQLNEEYLVIFKVILLLNILYKIANVGKESLVIPSEKNIKNVFIGSIYQDKVGTVLNYIDEKGIINKTPDGLFELTTNSLPEDQVREEIKKLRNSTGLHSLLVHKKDQIKREFNKVIRETEVDIHEVIYENRLIKDIEKGIFKYSGYLHIILFICITQDEYHSIKKIIKSVINKNLLKDILIVVSDAVLGEEDYGKYIDFKARARLNDKHNYKEDAKLYTNYAEGIINKWVNDIKRKPFDWYLNDEFGKLPLSNLISYINTNLSRKIFKYGLENISATLENENIWTKVLAKNLAENYQTSNTLKELDSNLNNVDNYSLAILLDNDGNYIVNNQLEIKEDVPDNHPVKIMQDYVDKRLVNAQSKGQFNLGNELKSLTEPPYGLYKCRVNIAALSFILRKYVNKLYDAKGNSINKTNMRNLIVSLFEFWFDGKPKRENELLIRFGSENEKKLCELINDIFDLKLDSNNQSADTVRWKLRNWIKENRAPLWLFKYVEHIDKNPVVSSAIDELFKFLKPNDANLPDSLIQDCYISIKSNKSDLKWCIEKDKEELFNKFLKTIDNELSPKDLNEIKKHLDNNMPEEPYDWKLDAIKVEVLTWINKKHEKKDSNFLVSFDDNILAVSLDKEATGEIVIHVSGIECSKKVVNGRVKFDLSKLEGGKSYSVNVSYSGDEKFLEKTTTVSFETKLKDPNMKVSIEGNVIKVSLDKDATGDILFDVDECRFAKIEKGKAIVDFPNLKGGETYNGKISYNGDNNFSSAELMVEFKAERENPNLDVSVNGNTVFITVDRDVTGDIIIDINDKKYSEEINKGNAQISIPNLEGGKKYNCIVSYSGNNRFCDAKTEVMFEIKSRNTIESIEKSDAKLVKNALIKALKDNKEITLELIVKYLESINSGDY